VGTLARYMSKPASSHLNAARGVLRYLAGTPDYGINYSQGQDCKIVGFCDADYAGDLDTRRSTTGYVFMFNGGAISWASRLQPTVAVSTTETEFMAAANGVKEALWLRNLASDFKLKHDTMEMYCDNQATIKILKHPVASARSKHIDVIYHFARERVESKEVKFDYCTTDKMTADVMTKALSVSKFEKHRTDMGVG